LAKNFRVPARTLLSAIAAVIALTLVAQAAIPNDPQFPAQWNLDRIGATNVWSVTTGSTEVVVAVIDTGVDYTHPDLASNMWRNPGETGIDARGNDKATNGLDDDRSGYADDVHGIDVYDHDGDPREIGYFDGTTTFYHGSDCAGIIGAAGNNGIGTVGINWRVSIMAICAFPLVADDFTEEAYVQAMIEAFDYVLAMKRRGVNIVVTSSSYFNASYSQTLKDLIDAVGNEGILNVFAAGNNSMNNDDIGIYPCGYNSPSIISVGNSTSAEVLAAASCYGKSTVHLTAPGRDGIRSAFTSDFRGTSASCPHVAGAVALLKAAVPDVSAAEIKAGLLGSVDQPAALRNQVVSNGRLNVAKALTRMMNTNAPVVVISAHPAGPRTRSNDAITVTFSRSMNATTVEAAFQIVPPTAGHFVWANQNRTFTFVPDAPLARTSHTAKILGSAQDANGGALDGNFDSTNQDSPTDDFVWTFRFPVPNDDFVDAQTILAASGFVDGTTRNAYPETVEPNHVGHLLSGPSVWYQWTAPVTGWFTFDTVQAASFDTLLAIYAGTNLAELEIVAGNDNDGSNSRSRSSFAAVAGTTYSIVAAGKSMDSNKAIIDGSSFGTFRLSWYPTPAPTFSVSPFSRTSAYPGQTITLGGANFSGATRVLFNGVSAVFANAFTTNADFQILATVPLGAMSGPITIETPHGNVTSTSTLTILPLPALSIQPVPGTNLVELSWPPVSGFSLQHGDALSPTGHWASFSIASRLTNGMRFGTTTIVPSNRFFRLHNANP
jgi:subtilisin family serine protease